jgi:phenylalanyl-tRNA synthetase beta chain
MKISLRWLCDHIVGLSWRDVNVQELSARFNAKVAEIEHIEQRSISLTGVDAVRVEKKNDELLAVCADGRTFTLPQRSDIQFPLPDAAAFLVRTTGQGAAWVTLHELGSDKDGLLPALHIEAYEFSGAWRNRFETEDIILDVDNKSLTHRPDMWGHRGFAREVAALFDKVLEFDSEFTDLIEVRRVDASEITDSVSGFSITQLTEGCSGFATLLLPIAQPRGCDVQAASRLLAIGYRPRNAAIDMTNYAMADWGHPLHAYDADRVHGKHLIVRQAQPNESLVLLDGTTAKLDQSDIVIADDTKALGLAGVMGGADDSLRSDTQHILLEAGCFHAATIRRTAARHKVRTESSQRFEKTLTSEQLVPALARTAFLARKWGVISRSVQAPIIMLAAPPKETFITIPHMYIVNRIGVALSSQQIMKLLGSIGFGVQLKREREQEYTSAFDTISYEVYVPAFRVTKDISGMHDIVEEIARLYGFDAIPPVLPTIAQRATDINPVLRERVIKHYLAYGAGMQEQRNYGFYNEQILATLGWQEESGVCLQNPVSQDAYRLVTSLMPHILGNVIDNSADVERCAFFEWGTVWPAGVESERKELAGVWYDKRGRFDFYTLKQVVCRILRCASVAAKWVLAPEQGSPQWLSLKQAAALMHNDECIGYFGLLHPVMVQKMGGLPESAGYGFVLNASLLQKSPAPRYTVNNLQKYQHSTLDVSVLISKNMFVAQLQTLITDVSPLIEQVSLLDFFEKKEWLDKRSVAFRIILSSPERVLTKDEIESVRMQIIAVLIGHGATLRE